MKKMEMVQIFKKALEELKELNASKNFEKFLERKDVMYIDFDGEQESYKLSIREEYGVDIYFSINTEKATVEMNLVDVFDKDLERMITDSKVGNVIKAMEFLNCFEECKIKEVKDKDIINSIIEEKISLTVAELEQLLEEENIKGIDYKELSEVLFDWNNMNLKTLYLINNKIYLCEKNNTSVKEIDLKKCLLEIITTVFDFALDCRNEYPLDYGFTYARVLKEIWSKWHTILDGVPNSETQKDWIKYASKHGENIDEVSLKDYLKRVNFKTSEKIICSLIERLGNSNYQIIEIDLLSNKILFLEKDKKSLIRFTFEEIMYKLFEDFIGGSKGANLQSLEEHFKNNKINISKESIENLIYKWWHDCYEYKIHLHNNVILQEDLQQEEITIKDEKEFMSYVAKEVLDLSLRNYKNLEDKNIKDLEKNVNHCFEWLKAIEEEIPQDSQKIWNEFKEEQNKKQKNSIENIEFKMEGINIYFLSNKDKYPTLKDYHNVKTEELLGLNLSEKEVEFLKKWLNNFGYKLEYKHHNTNGLEVFVIAEEKENNKTYTDMKKGLKDVLSLIYEVVDTWTKEKEQNKDKYKEYKQIKEIIETIKQKNSIEVKMDYKTWEEKEKVENTQCKSLNTTVHKDLLEDLFKTKLGVLMPNITIEKFSIKEDGYYLKHTVSIEEIRRTIEIYTEGKDLKVSIVFSNFKEYPMEITIKKETILIAQEQILEGNNILTTEAFLLLKKLY